MVQLSFTEDKQAYPERMVWLSRWFHAKKAIEYILNLKPTLAS